MRIFPGSRILIPALIWGMGLSFGGENLEFRVEGQAAFNARRIESLIGSPDFRPDWQVQDWESWAADAASLLTDAYRDEGYFDARTSVQPALPDSSRGGRPAVIFVRVFEGPRYQFGAVDIRLPGGIFPSYHASDLRCRAGRPFDKSFIYQDRRDLLKFFGDGGFLKAQAAESLFYDTTRKAVNVAFHLNPGQALVFDTLILNLQREGDTSGKSGKTSAGLLRSLFPLHRGDTLSLKQITTFERKLKSTRVFNFVRVRDSLLPEPGGRSGLVLNAEEKTPGDMQLSGFWENLYGLGAGIGLSYANLDGHLQEASTDVTFAQRKQSLSLGYGAPLFFGTSVRFDNDFVVDWYQDDAFTDTLGWFHGDFDVSNQSKFSRQLLRWMRVASGVELLGKSTLSDSGRQRGFNLDYINSVFVEQVDNPVNPTRGSRLEFTWGNGGAIAENGNLAFFGERHNWLEANDAAYFPFGQWLVLALRLDGGRFFGKGGIDADRFFLGGPRSIRSEDWRHVCPEVVGGICIDDIEPAYFLASGELRLQPFQPGWISAEGKLRYLLGLQVVPFVDYGNIWEVGKNLTSTGQGRAVGVGLRYVILSLFNIRLDYAWDPRDASQYRWIIDLSQAF